jgi:drug/metabolite transporter (DMT)-like permease
MFWGILGAAVAAVAYGVATILQAIGVRHLAALGPGASLRQRITAGRAYGFGLALDAVGFVASVGALRTLPLFLVESAVAGSVAVTALLAVVWLGAKISRAEVAAIAATLIGLVLLAVSAQDGAGKSLALEVRWIVLAGVPVLGLVLLAANRIRSGGTASLVLSATCGLGFGLVGIAARTIEVPHPVWHVLGDPSFWAIVGYGIVSIVAYGFALHRGRVTTVAAITFAVETVFPATVGLIWLGDAVRPNLGPVALVGFLATVGGSIALAAHAEPEA